MIVFISARDGAAEGGWGKQMRALRAVVTTFLAAAVTALLVPAAAATVVAVPPDQWTSEYAGGQNASTNPGEQLITPATAPRLTQAWQVSGTLSADFVAPAIVNGVVYRAVNAGNALTPAEFVALSARTGQQLWSIPLPASAEWYRGQTVVGNIVLLPFEGWHQLGGITAIDLTTHKILWSVNRPPSTTNPGNDDGTGGPIVADSGRVYLIAGNNVLSAFNIQTGALLWHINPPAWIKGIAAAGGRVYTAGFPSSAGPGLVAYDGATGNQLWTSPALYGIPVVVGNEVLVPTSQGVAAVAAAGCGHASCPRIWSAGISNADPQSILIGGADQNTFFATAGLTDRTGRLMRFSTTTGARQWTIQLAQQSNEIPIRAGGTVWVMANANAVIGWSASATTPTPLRKIALPANSYGAVGGLAAASGSLVVDVWGGAVTAYRVPGT